MAQGIRVLDGFLVVTLLSGSLFSLASGATTKAPCTENTWEKLENEHGFFATQGATDEITACQAECIENTDCYAVDFNRNENSCWLHTDPQYKGITRTFDGIDQYRLTRCQSATASQVAGQTTLGQQGTTAVQQGTTAGQQGTTAGQPQASKSSDCTAHTWDEYPDTHSFYGILTEDTTREACQLACIELEEEKPCLALDFDTVAQPNACYLLVDPAIFNITLPAPGVIHYELNRCEGATVGKPETTAPATTLLATTAKQDSSPGSNDNCTTDEWDEYPDTHSFFGILTEASTLEDCQMACLERVGEETCGALDFDTVAQPNACYLLVDPDVYKITLPAPGVNHYKLKRCANKPSQMTSVMTAGTAGVVTTADCGKWEVFPNRHSRDGLEVDKRSVDECKAYCVSLPDCVAVDFNKEETSCFYYTDPEQIKVYANRENIDQHQYTRCNAQVTTASSNETATMGETGGTTGGNFTGEPATGGNSTATSEPKMTTAGEPKCNPVWQIYLSTHSSGGVEQKGIKTLEDCQDVCAQDPENCAGLDFNNQEKSCWIYDNATKLEAKAVREYIDQYVLLDCLEDNETEEPEGTKSQEGTQGGTTLANTMEGSMGSGGTQSATEAETGNSGTPEEQNETGSTKKQQNTTGVTESGTGVTKSGTEATNSGTQGGSMETNVGTMETQAATMGNVTGTMVTESGTMTIADVTDAGTMETKGSDTIGTEVFPTPTASGGSTAQGLSEGTMGTVEFSEGTGMGGTGATMETEGSSDLSEPVMSTTQVPIPCVPSPTWASQENKAAKGGEVQPSINTLEPCQLLCIEIPACIAITFRERGTLCSLYYGEGVDDDAVANPFNQETSTLYILTRLAGCGSGEGTAGTEAPSGTGSTNAVQPSGTQGTNGSGSPSTARFSSSVAPGSKPTELFTVSPSGALSTKGSGGITTNLVSSRVVTSQPVVSGAVTSVGSTGLRSASSVLASSAFASSGPASSPAASSGVSTSGGAAGATTGSACVPTFQVNLNTNSPGAQRIEDISTLEECQQYCIDNECFAIDFNHANQPNECWVYDSDEMLDIKANRDGVDQYIIDRCVSGGVSPTTETEISTSGASASLTSVMVSSSQVPSTAATSQVASSLLSTSQLSVSKAATTLSTQVPSTASSTQPISSRESTSQSTASKLSTVLSTRVPSTAVSTQPISSKESTSQSTASKLTTVLSTHVPSTAVSTQPISSGGSTSQSTTSRISTVLSTAVPSGAATSNIASSGDSSFAAEATTQLVTNRGTPTGATGGTCEPTFEQIKNTHSPGALLTQFTTLEACKQYCIERECFAIDFNYFEDPDECWYYDTDEQLSIKATREGIDQYIIQRCSETSGDSAVSAVSTGSQPQSSPVTGDVPTVGEATFLPTSVKESTSVASTNILVTSTNILVTTAGSSANAPISTGTVASVSLAATTGGTCEPTFEQIKNTHSPGALLTQFTTLEECKQYCIERECFAIDFNYFEDPDECWYYDTDELLSIKASREGIDQYIIQRCLIGETNGDTVRPTVGTSSIGPTVGGSSTLIGGTTNTRIGGAASTLIGGATSNIISTAASTSTLEGSKATACAPTFEQIKNTHSPGALLTGVTTLEACKQYCIERECFAIDFNYFEDPDECWYYDTDEQLSIKATREGIDQYIISRCN